MTRRAVRCGWERSVWEPTAKQSSGGCRMSVARTGSLLFSPKRKSPGSWSCRMLLKSFSSVCTSARCCAYLYLPPSRIHALHYCGLRNWLATGGSKQPASQPASSGFPKAQHPSRLSKGPTSIQAPEGRASSRKGPAPISCAQGFSERHTSGAGRSETETSVADYVEGVITDRV